jgi:mandelate racemase
MALSLLDMALWDAIAQMHRVPLATLLGGRPQALSAYDSRDLGLMEQDRLKAETIALVELGLKAFARGTDLDRTGVYWLEEPIIHDDYASARELRVPVQVGENVKGPTATMQALEWGACDFVMPDVARIGGVSGWMLAAGVAAAKGNEMSSHLMPEISAQLLSATPTAHWPEYPDWADAIFETPLRNLGWKG